MYHPLEKLANCLIYHELPGSIVLPKITGIRTNESIYDYPGSDASATACEEDSSFSYSLAVGMVTVDVVIVVVRYVGLSSCSSVLLGDQACQGACVIRVVVGRSSWKVPYLGTEWKDSVSTYE